MRKQPSDEDLAGSGSCGCCQPRAIMRRGHIKRSMKETAMNPQIATIDDVSFRAGPTVFQPVVSAKRLPISLSKSRLLTCVMAIALCVGIASSSHAQTADNQLKLDRLMYRLPDADADADADKDGKLTIYEAKAYLAAHPEMRRKREADGKGTAGEATVGAAMLDLYEAREFKGVKYRLLKPIDLAQTPDKKYPLILSLHGAAGQGADNVRNLREWNKVLAREELRRKHPCFVVAPQSIGPWRTPAMAANHTDEKIANMSKAWQEIISRSKRRKSSQDTNGGNLDRVFELLDSLAKDFQIDTDRVYVVGHSMGGFGTWTAVAEQPNRFAAAITSAVAVHSVREVLWLILAQRPRWEHFRGYVL